MTTEKMIEEFEEYEDYVRENGDCFASASETSDVIDYMKELAMRMPTVEAEPVVHGEWKMKQGDEGVHWYCSKCREESLFDIFGYQEKSNYCPNCGAKMDGGVKNE